MAYKGRKLKPLQLFARTTSSHITWWLGRRFPQAIPLVFVSGYPRSGTIWASQLVSDYLQIPFPRNSLLPVGCPAVVHAHHFLKASDGPCVYMIRDVRDTMVSAYHFYLRSVPPGDRPAMPRRLRQAYPGLVNKEDIARNLPAFIEQQMKRPIGTPATWTAHVSAHLELNHPRLARMKYEDLISDTAGTLSNAIATMQGETPNPEAIGWAVKKYSFANQAGRSRGQENRGTHIRKASVGEWRSVFTREAAQIIQAYCGQVLIAAGYEKDDSWVDSLESTASPAPVATGGA